MKTWLILDATYLCWRNWYAMGTLSYGDVGTGVVFGFLRDIITLQDNHNTNRFAFCFDYGKALLRERDYPAYKSGRRQKEMDSSEEDQELFKFFKAQVKNLRTKYLQQLGYRNIFWQEGYEADDIIASIVLSDNRPNDHYIIVSADHDMFQLLGKRVSVWSPKLSRLITEDSFSREYGVSPTQWIDVKAIAGCSSDSIEGVRGVGEKTAAKFISGKLKTDSKAFEKIVKGNSIWESNRHLVKLPYPGCGVPELVKDNVQASSWQELTVQLGMNSLRDKAPVKPGQRQRATTRHAKVGFGLCG